MCSIVGLLRSLCMLPFPSPIPISPYGCVLCSTLVGWSIVRPSFLSIVTTCFFLGPGPWLHVRRDLHSPTLTFGIFFRLTTVKTIDLSWTGGRPYGLIAVPGLLPASKHLFRFTVFNDAGPSLASPPNEVTVPVLCKVPDAPYFSFLHTLAPSSVVSAAAVLNYLYVSLCVQNPTHETG